LITVADWAALSSVPVVLSQTPTCIVRPRLWASASRGVPVYSQLSLAFMYHYVI